MKHFICGTTYYSHANPEDELERNFRKIREYGVNAVRVAEIWPGWSVIEYSPGQYDFKLLDDYVEKAVKNGLRICMGVGINDTPFWLYTKYPDLRMVNFDGKKSNRRIHSADFNHMEYRKHMEKYIRTIVQHYVNWNKNCGKEGEGIFSWQFGNEIRYNVEYCDSPATRIRFRQWLKEIFSNDLEALNHEWGTYYHDWEEVYPYKSREGAPTEGTAPHCLRTLEFQNWSIGELISWGVGIMKEYTDLPIFHNNFDYPARDHWLLTKPCDIAVIDIYATTYANPGYYNGLMIDATRSIATQQNKDMWIGETSIGQYGTYERDNADQRIVENCVMEQIGAGAKAIFYFRHKSPIWEQPHKFTGSQTVLRVDESELEYIKTPKNIRSFLQYHEKEILDSKHIRPKVAVYYPKENVMFSSEAGYKQIAIDSSVGSRGIWSGIQVPVELIDTEGITTMDLSIFDIIHIPVTYLLPSETAEYLKKFVAEGGVLICEGRPGYVNEHGLLYKKQPGAGLDEVLGALEDKFYNVDFIKLKIELEDINETMILPSFVQTLRVTNGKVFGKTENGEITGVFNKYGKGTAYFFGGGPSLNYGVGTGKYETNSTNSLEFDIEEQRRIICSIFQKIAAKHGVVKPIEFEGGIPSLSVRYLENKDSTLIFCVNYSKTESTNLLFPEKYNNSLTGLTLYGKEVLEGRNLIIPPLGWRALQIKNSFKQVIKSLS